MVVGAEMSLRYVMQAHPVSVRLKTSQGALYSKTALPWPFGEQQEEMWKGPSANERGGKTQNPWDTEEEAEEASGAGQLPGREL